QWHLNNSPANVSTETKRQRMVLAKNAIWVACVVAIVAVWATKIAGFALSIAAVAGAILLVSKEVLTCFLGYALITVSRPYRIGDFVEIGNFAGRVIDIDAFSTTLADTGKQHQLTGRTLSFPNSLILTVGVRNISATGDYIVAIQSIALPLTVDLQTAERCAIDAASEATDAWREQADRHLKTVALSMFIDLPSSRPRVYWEALDGKLLMLNIRYACPPESRASTEQEIFRKVWFKLNQTGALAGRTSENNITQNC
ncbi:mechanosensitive ion channel family protein, partial [Nostoc sp. CHAB 5834]|nr:mechanosensitive ion channel family protein [Nostoc sp. CHAB 5834]